MYLEIFLADFALFWKLRGISQKYLNFADPRPREISEPLIKRFMSVVFILRQTRVLEYFPFATSTKCRSLFSTCFPQRLLLRLRSQFWKKPLKQYGAP